MKAIQKRIITALLAIALCFSTISVAVSADNYVYPVKPDVKQWHKVTAITAREKGEEVFTLTTTVNAQPMNFYISFPKEGGFRLYTDTDGVFQPECLEKIDYSTDTAGHTVLTAPDGTVLTIKESTDAWSLAVSRDKEELVTLNSGDMEFGYDIWGELAEVRLTTALYTDEQLYGFGERFNAVNQVGYKLQLWNLDSAYHSSDSVMETKTYSYINVPIIHSTKGYTLFMNSQYCVDADLGATDSTKYVLESYGPKFDFYYWTKSAVENIQSYTALTGRSFLPPKWAFSYWAGATGANWEKSGGGGTNLMNEFLTGYRNLGLGALKAVYVEWDTMFERVAYNMCRKNGTNMLIWVCGYTSKSKILDTLKVVDSEAPIVKSSINTNEYPEHLNANTVFIDYTHPLAKEYYKKYLEQYVQWGLKGMMVDMGEKIPDDAVWYNGMDASEMHNFSSYYYLQAVNEAMTELNNGGKDFILFQRSGTAGSQQFGANFLGDNDSKSSGLKQQINAGLSLSASGFGTWGGDIGGFNTVHEEELYLRWVGFSVFEPLMREHGSGTIAPWAFSEYAQQVFVKYYWLRENIVDTIYSAAATNSKYGIPMAQTMQMAYPDETDTHNTEYQYMFCDNMLVAPITETGTVSREVALPTGTWYNLWDGFAVNGGKTVTANAPQDQIPVYLKSGAVMPITVADTLKLMDSLETNDTVKALLVTPSENEATSFEDFDDTAESSIVYTNTPKKNGGFTITAQSPSDKRAVMAYGVLASSVKVDGRYLPKVSGADDGMGYYIESGKTVISLPAGRWEKIEINGIKADNIGENLALKATVTDSKNAEETTVLASLKNDDSEYYWSAPSTGDPYLQLEFDKKYDVSTMVLKWGSGYAKEYTVEVSSDGENWKTAYTTEDGSGGIETVNFSAEKVKYIRISDFKRNGKIPATLYNISVYGEQDVPTSIMSTGLLSTFSAASAITGGSTAALFTGVALMVLSLVAFAVAVILKAKNRKTGKIE